MSGLDSGVIALTHTGDALVIAAISAVLGVLLIYLRRYRLAAFVWLAVGGGLVIGAILKQLIQRERPPADGRLIEVANYSLPSIHALGSCALALCVIVMVWRTRYRSLALTVLSVYVVGVGLSRVYLGVHYLSDVALGWVVAGAWVYVAWRGVGYDASNEK